MVERPRQRRIPYLARVGILSAKSDFITIIKGWVARPDHSDLIVDSFIRTAESNLQRNLRVKEMIQLSDAIVTQRRIRLPLDWRELDYVRLNDSEPLDYISRHDFFSGSQQLTDKYTIVGDYALFGGDVFKTDGLAVEISYYKNIPHLETDATWLYTTYYDIFLQACNVVAYLYGLEVEKANALSVYVEGLVTSANNEHLISRVSGSQLKMPRARMRIG